MAIAPLYFQKKASDLGGFFAAYIKHLVHQAAP